MPNVRLEHVSGKWWISKAAYRHARSYALMYWEWEADLRRFAGLKAASGDGMPRASGPSNPTARDAEKIGTTWAKMSNVDECLRMASPTLWKWLKEAVTHEGVTYESLAGKGMPCGRTLFYDARRKFYWLLSKRI